MTLKKAVVKKTVKKVVKKTAPKKSKKEIANEEKFNELVAQITNKEERGFTFVAILEEDSVKEVAACINKTTGLELIKLMATLATSYNLEDELIKVLLVSKIHG